MKGGPTVASDSSAAPSVAGADSAILGFGGQVVAIAIMEVTKLLRDPTEIISRAIQPVLWLVVFGEVFTRTHAIPTGALSYLEFMAPGVLAQGVLFSAIFFGIAVIWERDLGIVHKLLASPAPRTTLVLGKAAAAGLRGLPQAIMIYLLAAVLGARVAYGPGPVLTALGFVILGSGLFATFSLIIACLVRTRERFMGIGQLLTMPLFFASNAIYPLAIMPRWLQVVARVNPLTYVVDALRGLMIEGGHSALGFGGDLAFPAAAFVVLLAIASRLYPGLVR